MISKSEIVKLLNLPTDLTSLDLEFRESLNRFGPAPGSTVVPCIMPAWVRDKAQELGPVIYRALEHSATHYFANYDPELMPAHLRNLVHNEHGYSCQHPMIRVDCFLDNRTKSFKVLELNTADPSAFAWNDYLIQSWRDLNVGASGSLQFDCMIDRYWQVTQKLYLEYCQTWNLAAKSDPTVALVVASSSTVLFDYKCLMHLLDTKGKRVLLVDPEDIGTNGESVYIRNANGTRIEVDIVIRDTLDEVISPDGEVLAPDFYQVLKNDLVCVLNPISSTYGDQKQTLCDLGRFAGTDYDRETLLNAIPTTIELTPGMGDERIANLVESQFEYVLKPCDGYGGFGVYVGRHLAPDEWESRVLNAVFGPKKYLAQSFVEPNRYRIPVGVDSSNDWQESFLNYSFWIMEGEYAGAFARVSQNPVINFHQGGALLPVGYIEN